jgi:hypothetical protein
MRGVRPWLSDDSNLVQASLEISVKLPELVFGFQVEPEGARSVQTGEGPKPFDLDQERPLTLLNG